MNINNIARPAGARSSSGFAVCGVALAQGNSIEALDVSQQAGTVVVRITTKEALKAPPRASPSPIRRASRSISRHHQALAAPARNISQGELRSMNVVQAADKTRLVLHLRRPVAQRGEAGRRSVVVTLQGAPAPTGDKSRISRRDATTQGMRFATSISGAAAPAKAEW